MKERLSAVFSFFTGRYAPAFITLLVLAAAFFFYFNVIVTRNEANLKERRFRALHRMADNIAKKIDNYRKDNSTHFLNAMKRAETNPSLRTVIENQYGLERKDKDSVVKKDSSFYIQFSDGWKFFFKDDTIPGKSLPAFAAIDKFLNPLLRRDLFPRYFLSFEDTILWDELNISHQRVSAYFPGKAGTDSVKSKAIQTGDIRNVEIQGKQYKLFLLPFIAGGQYKFRLGGYIPEEDYIDEERYIPTYAILWLVIGIIVVVLMFPLLKIFLMHRSEQLHARNAVYSLASLFVLGSVVVLASLGVYMYFTIVRQQANNDITYLANRIDTSFRQEIDTAMVEMDSAEARLHRLAVEKKNIDSLDKAEYKPVIYPYLLHLSWADSAGMQRIRWAPDKYRAEKIDVHSRDYFLAVKEGNLWKSKNNKPYYLTEVSSRIENKNLAIISRPFAYKDSILNPITMMSLSGSFRSLFNIIVPEEFGFCIIKENGDILFHLDQNRNLNENLVEECDNDPALLSFLHARTKGHFGADYAGSSQRFYIKPIEGMPYYIVTFRSMKQVWAEDLDIISACSIFTLMNLAIILLVILITQLVGVRRSSLLEHPSISFYWLKPNQYLGKAYQEVTLAYICAIILQVIFFWRHKSADQLSQVGIAFSYSFLLLSYAYYKFTRLSDVDVALINNLSGYKFTDVFAKQPDEEGNPLESPSRWKIFWYKIKDFVKIGWFKISDLFTNLKVTDTGEGKLQAKMALRVLLLIYIVSITLFFFNLYYNAHGCSTFLLSQLLLFPVIYIARKMTGYLEKKRTVSGYRMALGTVEQKKNYRWWYITSVFCFIAATAMIPSVIFYYMSFKQERILSKKYTQLEFVRKLLQQPPDTMSPPVTEFHPSYRAPFYYQTFADSIKRSAPPGDSSKNSFEIFYKSIKPSFSTYSSRIEFLKDKCDSAGDFNWTYVGKSIVLNYKITQANSYFNTAFPLAIYSPVESGLQKTGGAIKNSTIEFLVFITIVLLLLAGFLSLLKHLLKKIFFYGYNDSTSLREFDSFLEMALPSHENFYITGLVNSSKHEMIKSYLLAKKIKEEEIVEFDIADLGKKGVDAYALAEVLKTGSDKKKVILIRHFEMFMEEFDVSDKKLSLLESVLKLRKQIIILSARSFEAMTLIESVEKGKGRDLTDRWSNVMNKFYTVYHQWKPSTQVSTDLLAAKKQTSNEIQAFCEKIINDFTREKNSAATDNDLKPIKEYLARQIQQFFSRLDQECNHNDFLNCLQKPILDYLRANKETCFHFDFQYLNKPHMLKIITRHIENVYENTCLRIQSLAYNYYQSVWQSLCPDEQRTLYDIAMDQMVNPANRDLATRLAEIGLVKRLDHLTGYEIMSKSFRNFIFTQLDKKELLKLRKEESEKGTWNNFQLPVLIVVIALSIFLFTTQKDAFNGMVAYLGTAIGAIAALLKLLGMTPSSKS